MFSYHTRILSMTVPLYNTEIAPPRIRGFLVGLFQQLLGIGFIVANWVGYGCQYIDSDASWRLALAMQLVPAGCLLVGIQFLPFSPVRPFHIIYLNFLSKANSVGCSKSAVTKKRTRWSSNYMERRRRSSWQWRMRSSLRCTRPSRQNS